MIDAKCMLRIEIEIMHLCSFKQYCGVAVVRRKRVWFKLDLYNLKMFKSKVTNEWRFHNSVCCGPSIPVWSRVLVCINCTMFQ